MAPRRASTSGGTSAPASRHRVQGRIRKNLRTRQAPTWYGQQSEAAPSTPGTAVTHDPASSSVEPEPSIPEYSHSPSSNQTLPSSAPASPDNPQPSPATPTTQSEHELPSPPHTTPDPPISLGTMRELLCSHEEDIVDTRGAQRHEPNPTPTRIAELEGELAQLREQAPRGDAHMGNPRALSMYNLSQPHILLAGENASAIAYSVEVLFPGVERGTLVQIIENQFKPTNIYRLLASEKERAELQPTINIGGIEFVQAERDGKESEYRMSIFFKAWAAYSGILVKLAPHSLKGDLATALSIYTMNLYDLLEKYTPTPAGQLKANGWKDLTREYPDQQVITAILGICHYGVRKGYEGQPSGIVIHPNLASAKDNTDIVAHDIESEMKKNRLELYSDSQNLPNYYTASPLGLADKADSSKRRIHHLSYPTGLSTSINCGIRELYGAIVYSGIDEGIRAVQEL
ncbi:hypothetical protein HOY80DRAFT_1041362 [Tuber brumale]|nr:hypothetical protein HOY80DRAFT_1041362 [Tuber brumale]